MTSASNGDDLDIAEGDGCRWFIAKLFPICLILREDTLIRLGFRLFPRCTLLCGTLVIAVSAIAVMAFMSGQGKAEVRLEVRVRRWAVLGT